MKHIHRAACAVGAVLLLAGCSSAPTAGVAGLAGGPGSIKIQAGTGEIPVLQEVAEDFTADTGVEVEFVQREVNAQTLSNFISQSPTGRPPTSSSRRTTTSASSPPTASSSPWRWGTGRRTSPRTPGRPWSTTA